MKALITGASYGFGADFARELSAEGWDLIIVARSKDKLEQLKKTLKTNVRVIAMDLSVEENLYTLYRMTKKDNVDMLINNAGYGLFGEFTETDLKTELNIIDLNIKAYHILTKLFLQDMVKRDSGRILNVGSAAGFGSGPKLSTYYATKAYILNLTVSIYEELRAKKSKVKISVFCPGPTATEFTTRAQGKFNFNEYNSLDMVRRCLKALFKDQVIIVPGIAIKGLVLLTRLLSKTMMAKITHIIQGK